MQQNREQNDGTKQVLIKVYNYLPTILIGALAVLTPTLGLTLYRQYINDQENQRWQSTTKEISELIKRINNQENFSAIGADPLCDGLYVYRTSEELPHLSNYATIFYGNSHTETSNNKINKCLKATLKKGDIVLGEEETNGEDSTAACAFVHGGILKGANIEDIFCNGWDTSKKMATLYKIFLNTCELSSNTMEFLTVMHGVVKNPKREAEFKDFAIDLLNKFTISTPKAQIHLHITALLYAEVKMTMMERNIKYTNEVIKRIPSVNRKQNKRATLHGISGSQHVTYSEEAAYLIKELEKFADVNPFAILMDEEALSETRKIYDNEFLGSSLPRLNATKKA